MGNCGYFTKKMGPLSTQFTIPWFLLPPKKSLVLLVEFSMFSAFLLNRADLHKVPNREEFATRWGRFEPETLQKWK